MNKNTVRSGSVNGAVETEIKFAGNDNKVKMYEPKHRGKLIRVLTVVAYVFSVSLAAIMLSLFYIFIYYTPGSHVNNSNACNISNIMNYTRINMKEEIAYKNRNSNV